jgi:hypothetical protein
LATEVVAGVAAGVVLVAVVSCGFLAGAAVRASPVPGGVVVRVRVAGLAGVTVELTDDTSVAPAIITAARISGSLRPKDGPALTPGVTLRPSQGIGSPFAPR